MYQDPCRLFKKARHTKEDEQGTFLQHILIVGQKKVARGEKCYEKKQKSIRNNF